MAKRQSTSRDSTSYTERSTSATYLNDFPLELFVHIFSYLSDEEKANVLVASSYALELAKHGEIHVEQPVYMKALLVAV
eukprot:4239689-Pleurochrysis_carterae.AAC.1